MAGDGYEYREQQQRDHVPYLNNIITARGGQTDRDTAWVHKRPSDCLLEPQTTPLVPFEQQITAIYHWTLECLFLYFLTSYNTAEPPNKGHVGTRSFVLYREVSFIQRLKCTVILGIGTSRFVLYREVSFIRSVLYQRFHCTCIKRHFRGGNLLKMCWTLYTTTCTNSASKNADH